MPAFGSATYVPWQPSRITWHQCRNKCFISLMNLLGFISQFIPELISFLIAWGDQCYAFCFIRSPGIFLHLIVHWYRFIPLYGEIHFKRQVSCPRTQHNGTVRSLTWSALPCKEVCRVTVITVLGSDSLEPVRRVETPRRIPHIHVYLVFSSSK